MEGKTEFVVFCIENVANRLNISAALVYRALAEKSRILYDYIIPNYDILSTQGKEYIVDDILETMEKFGVTI